MNSNALMQPVDEMELVEIEGGAIANRIGGFVGGVIGGALFGAAGAAAGTAAGLEWGDDVWDWITGLF